MPRPERGLIVAQIVAGECVDVESEPFLPQTLDLHRVRVRHRMPPATPKVVQCSLIGPIRWYGPTETNATTIVPEPGGRQGDKRFQGGFLARSETPGPITQGLPARTHARFSVASDYAETHRKEPGTARASTVRSRAGTFAMW